MLTKMLEHVDKSVIKQYEHVLKHLKSKKIRLTETRKAIILYLVNSKKHPSAEMIYHDLFQYFGKMNLATVYNNLNFLVSEKIIVELKSSGTTTYYDFLDHDHHHIVCEKCGAIADFEYASTNVIIEKAMQETGYIILDEIITIKGICPICQKNNE